MGGYAGPQQLNYLQASRRVGRSVVTVKRWRRNGMPVGWRGSGPGRERVVREDVLLAWWRDRMKADPVHRLRPHSGEGGVVVVAKGP